MGWTQGVTCNGCGGHDWTVREGQWTCSCGKVMTIAEVAAYHKAESG